MVSEDISSFSKRYIQQKKGQLSTKMGFLRKKVEKKTYGLRKTVGEWIKMKAEVLFYRLTDNDAVRGVTDIKSQPLTQNLDVASDRTFGRNAVIRIV